MTNTKEPVRQEQVRLHHRDGSCSTGAQVSGRDNHIRTPRIWRWVWWKWTNVNVEPLVYTLLTWISSTKSIFTCSFSLHSHQQDQFSGTNTASCRRQHKAVSTKKCCRNSLEDLRLNDYSSWLPVTFLTFYKWITAHRYLYLLMNN